MTNCTTDIPESAVSAAPCFPTDSHCLALPFDQHDLFGQFDARSRPTASGQCRVESASGNRFVTHAIGAHGPLQCLHMPLRFSNHLSDLKLHPKNWTPEVFEVWKTYENIISYIQKYSKQSPGEFKGEPNRYLHASSNWATRLGMSKFTTSDTFGMSSLSGN